MALQKQILHLPLAGGLDKKTAERLVQPGSFLQLENAEFDQDGIISKRKGYTKHIDSVMAPKGLVAKDDDLIALGGQDAATSMERVLPHLSTVGTGEWRTDGDLFVPCTVCTSKIDTPKEQAIHGDVAVNGAYLCYIYRTAATSTNLRIVVVEKTSGSVVVTHDYDTGGSSDVSVRVLAIANAFTFVSFVPGNSRLRIKYLLLSDLYSLEDGVYEITVWPTTHFDCASDGDLGVIVGQASGEIAFLQVVSFDYTGALQDVYTGPSEIENYCNLWIGPFDLYGAGTIDAVYTTSITAAGGLVLQVFRLSDLTRLNTSNDTIEATGTPRSAVGCCIGSTTHIFYTMYDATIPWIQHRSVTFAYSNPDYECTFSDASRMESCRIDSKPIVYNSTPYIWTTEVLDDEDHQAYCLRGAWRDAATDHGDYAIAKATQYRALSTRTWGHASAVVDLGSGKFLTAAMYNERIEQSDEFWSNTVRSLFSITVDFAPKHLARQDAGEWLLVGGGQLCIWDGYNLVELGFAFPPVYISLADATTGGHLVDGTYLYKAIYEWTDKRGRLHRSSPTSDSCVVNGGGSTQKVTIVFDAMHHSGPGKADYTRFVVFRQYNGVYYELIASGSDEWNVKGDNTITIVDNDALDISGHQLLYTESGELDSDPPPPTNIITMSHNRVFVVASDDPTVLWYSKPVAAGLAPEFSAFLTKQILAGGDITGLAVLGNNVIVFKARQIRHFYGDGPNALGVGAFSPDGLLSDDIGCCEAASVAPFAGGVLFRSHKGWYILPGQGPPSYVGGGVKDYEQYPALSTVVVRDRDQIRILLDGTTDAIVYDYRRHAWAVWTNHDGTDACMWDGNYCWMHSDGHVRQQSSAYFDSNAKIAMKAQFPHINVAGILGCQRVYQAQVTGEGGNSAVADVHIGVSYDGRDAIAEVSGARLSSLIDAEDVFTAEIKPTQQRCESIALTVYDARNESAFRLVSMALRLGVKTGMARRREAARLEVGGATAAPAAPGATSA